MSTWPLPAQPPLSWPMNVQLGLEVRTPTPNDTEESKLPLKPLPRSNCSAMAEWLNTVELPHTNATATPGLKLDSRPLPLLFAIFFIPAPPREVNQLRDLLSATASHAAAAMRTVISAWRTGAGRLARTW